MKKGPDHYDIKQQILHYYRVDELSLREKLPSGKTRRTICSLRKWGQIAQMKHLQKLILEDLPVEGRNIVMYGNPGTGKTHIAIGLGIKACMDGFTVFFTTVPHLLVQIREAKTSKTLLQLEARFKKYDLVICDEFGYVGFATRLIFCGPFFNYILGGGILLYYLQLILTNSPKCRKTKNWIKKTTRGGYIIRNNFLTLHLVFVC